MENIDQKVFNQVMALWVLPEIEKRKKINLIQDKFNLRSAQVIFSMDKSWIKVRLNDEVKAIANVKVNIPKNKGEVIYENEVDDIKSIELTDDDPNCGHITILYISGRWVISFNFLYNKKKAMERIEAGTEFLESAEENLKKNRLRPFLENSFGAAELFTEAILIRSFDIKSLKDHKSRLSRITYWAELGNVKIDFPNNLKLLTSLRSSARYMSSNEFKKAQGSEIIRVLHEMKMHAMMIDSVK